jgi:hypothetical protein
MFMNPYSAVRGKLRTLVQGTQAYFEYNRRSYYRQFRVDPSLTDHKQQLEELVRDGISIIPNFMSSESIQKISSELYPALHSVREKTYPKMEHALYQPEWGIYQLESLDKLHPVTNEFFNHPTLNSLARAYVSPDFVMYRKMAELKYDIGVGTVTDMLFHFDDWKFRFKAFMYLSDVGEDQAPLVYLKGSHQWGDWKRDKEYEYYRYGKTNGAYGSFHPYEIAYLQKKYGFEEMKCLGKAGTLILFDARGLHRGTLLKKDHRLFIGSFIR